MKSEIGEHESVSTAVIRAVSAVDGREPGSLPPLTDVIDPDAMDALFHARSTDLPQTGGRLTFTYSGCRITIDDGELLTIEPLEPTGRQSAQSDRIGGTKRSGPTRDTQQPATQRTPGSLVCFVCQQPMDREELQRERGELVHLKCRAELRCGISLETWSDR